MTPLRRRIVEDMRIRNLAPNIQRMCLRLPRIGRRADAGCRGPDQRR